MSAISCNVRVLRQKAMAPDIRRLTVALPKEGPLPKAGQFYMLRAWAANESPVLSRPISVHDVDEAEGSLTFLYQIKGEGTQKLAHLAWGQTLTITGPCGNGFDVEAAAKAGKVAVVGGGIGTAPLLFLCKQLAAAGCKPDLKAGFRDKALRPGGVRALLRQDRPCHRHRRGGPPRPGHRPAGPRRLRPGADLRPRRDDARRGQAVP